MSSRNSARFTLAQPLALNRHEGVRTVGNAGLEDRRSTVPRLFQKRCVKSVNESMLIDARSIGYTKPRRRLGHLCITIGCASYRAPHQPEAVFFSPVRERRSEKVRQSLEHALK